MAWADTAVLTLAEAGFLLGLADQSESNRTNMPTAGKGVRVTPVLG